jgi:preprotein translocase subunit SecA
MNPVATTEEIHATTTEDRRRLEAECDEATRDVLLKASVLVYMADRAWGFEAHHLDALRDAVHRRDAAIAALRAARDNHRSNS